MELLRILLVEIPRASPARQREQTATGAVARPYREDGRPPGQKRRWRKIRVWQSGQPTGKSPSDCEKDDARLRALSHCATIPTGRFWRKGVIHKNGQVGWPEAELVGGFFPRSVFSLAPSGFPKSGMTETEFQNQLQIPCSSPVLTYQE
jgi:hypothetical protein